MALYSQESLDLLRAKIDLPDLIGSYVQLKRSGASYKALCPFHEEKTPSFQIQAGDDHYHCFGCGAHGDAIAFLMNLQKMSFVEAVEVLAERFGVTLEKSEEKGGPKGPTGTNSKSCSSSRAASTTPSSSTLKRGMRRSTTSTSGGSTSILSRPSAWAIRLTQREAFKIFAYKEGWTDEMLLAAGLITDKGRDFFSGRVMFPVTDTFGAVVGYSARKIKEETFGGKYVNTPETPLFKKSHLLFGLSHSRQRIAKERRAVIVEGQIDALRLIHEGLNLAVASQGTAFAEGHVKLLTDLGVQQVILAFDSDSAGKTAALKVGNLFQKEGIGVNILTLPANSDPDSFVREEGLEPFLQKMQEASDYLTFLVNSTSEGVDRANPAQKNQWLRKLSEQIRSWEEPVLVHESLRKLAQLTSVPESVVGVGASQNHFFKRHGQAGRATIDPDRILEADLLRWLVLHQEEKLVEIARRNVTAEFFSHPTCKKIYTQLIESKGPCDLISLGALLETDDEQSFLSELVQKKVNPHKAEAGLIEAIERLLTRKWMEEREAIKTKIQSGGCSEEEVLALAKAFDAIKKNAPKVQL
jgi:DNA primase